MPCAGAPCVGVLSGGISADELIEGRLRANPARCRAWSAEVVTMSHRWMTGEARIAMHSRAKVALTVAAALILGATGCGASQSSTGHEVAGGPAAAATAAG